MNPGIRYLNGPIQSFDAPCSQCINNHHRIWLCLTDHTFQDLQCLHSGLSHHSWDQCTYLCRGTLQKAKFFCQMSGNLQVVNYRWSQCIRCYIAVSQSHQQYRSFLSFSHLFDLLCKKDRNLPVIIFILVHHLGYFHGNIASHRLSDGFGTVFRINAYRSGIDPVFIVPLLSDMNSCQFFFSLFQILFCLQGQIRTYLKITTHIFSRFLFIFTSFLLFFSNFSEICIDTIQVLH